MRTYLRLLLGAVVVVLLVACVNLASANLARAAGRSRELAVRAVLGAGRARLVRQLLTENLLISLLGGAGGLLLAHWLIRALVAMSPHALPRVTEIRLSGPVLLFALFISVATGLLIGVLPALQLGGRDLRAAVTAGGRGLVLAAIGIYGVLAYSVARRTREIGVRMALGAVRTNVVGMVLRDSLSPVVAGAAIGVVAGIAATRLMTALLYGVAPTDPLTFGAVVFVLLAVATVASIVPASRAARVDPVVALREE